MKLRTALISLGIAFTIGSRALANPAQSNTTKIGVVDMQAVKESCSEVGIAAAVRSEAQSQMNLDMQSVKNDLVRMRTEGKSAAEIEAHRKRLQINLNRELETLNQAVKNADDIARQKIGQAFEKVRSAESLDILVEKNGVLSEDAAIKQNVKNVTDDVIAQLKADQTAVGNKVSTSSVSGTSGANGTNNASISSGLNGAIRSGSPLAKNQSVGGCVFSGKEFSPAELVRLQNAGIECEAKNDSTALTLTRGRVLIAPSASVIIKIGNATLLVPKNAVAWVVKSGEQFAVYTLNDGVGRGRVKLTVGSKEILLAPAVAVLISNQADPDFNRIDSGRGYAISCSSIKKRTLLDGPQIRFGNFSVAQALAGVPIIRNLLNSNDKNERKLAASLIKNATILADLTGTI